MKKLLLFCASAIVASTVFAVPTAQVTFGMTRDLFFKDGGWVATTDAGMYVELILQQNNTAYVEANYDAYLVVAEDVGFYKASASYHETGKNAAGSALTAGKSQVTWQFTVSTYDNYYASWRVYNNASKSSATKYLVVPTWKQVTVDIADPMGAEQLVTWSSTNDRAYLKYDVPAVPEPTTMALFGLSGLGLLLRRKMRKEA